MTGPPDVISLLRLAEQTKHLWQAQVSEQKSSSVELCYLGPQKMSGSPLIHHYRLGNHRLVIKLFEEKLIGMNRFLLSRGNEVRAMQAATPDLTPEVHYFEPDDGFLVLGWCGGRHPAPQELTQPEPLEPIAMALSRIHRPPISLSLIDCSVGAKHY